MRYRISVNRGFYSFIFKVHLHNTKYFLLAREEFQETSISGKRSERKKVISKCQRLTYQKTFKTIKQFFLSKKNNLTFLGFEMIDQVSQEINF